MNGLHCLAPNTPFRARAELVTFYFRPLIHWCLRHTQAWVGFHQFRPHHHHGSQSENWIEIRGQIRWDTNTFLEKIDWTFRICCKNLEDWVGSASGHDAEGAPHEMSSDSVLTWDEYRKCCSMLQALSARTTSIRPFAPSLGPTARALLRFFQQQHRHGL